MKNLKSIIAILGLILSVNMVAQVAPSSGKKILEVKETIEEEYFKVVTTEGLSDALMKQLYKIMPKKLGKYGFSDIAIEEMGKVADTEDLLFQVNLIDNVTKDKFKIRLSMLSKNPKYIIKEINLDDYAEGYFCNEIEEENDKFTNKTTFDSPILNPISFRKVKIGDKVSTFIKIDVIGITANVGKKGVIILFEDGTKIERPDEVIDVNVNKKGGGFLYRSFFELNQEDIEKLSQNRISDVRLFIFDREINNGFKLQEYMKCIKDK